MIRSCQPRTHWPPPKRFSAAADSRRGDYTRNRATIEIRKQALAMVKGFIEPMDLYKADGDRQWLTRLNAAGALGIHWDATREQFVAKGR